MQSVTQDQAVIAPKVNTDEEGDPPNDEQMAAF
jgi:hypothetical protein